MTEYVHVGAHADLLAAGRILAPGERIAERDLDEEDRHIIDAGRLVDVKTFDQPKVSAPDAS